MIAKILWSLVIWSFMLATTWAGTITGKVTFFGKGRKNAAVHLVGVKGDIAIPEEHPMIDQKGQTYIPRVLPVVKGSTVDFPNSDTVIHNAFSLTPGNAFDFGTYGPGKRPSAEFNTAGKVDVFCNMHEQMHGIVLVLEHPYFSITSKKGKFEIKDVPEGTYTIKAWASPSLTEETTVTVGPTGTVDITIAVKKG